MPVNDSYYLFSENKTYTISEAKRKCMEMNGNLATISDKYIQDRLSEAINRRIEKRIWDQEGDIINYFV